MYIVTDTAIIGLLGPWVLRIFQRRIYIVAAKSTVKKPSDEWNFIQQVIY